MSSRAVKLEHQQAGGVHHKGHSWPQVEQAAIIGLNLLKRCHMLCPFFRSEWSCAAAASLATSNLDTRAHFRKAKIATLFRLDCAVSQPRRPPLRTVSRHVNLCGLMV